MQTNSSETLHIAVAGNIGAGKTTLVKLLAEHYKWEVHLESVDDNPYLADFYHDMKRWAFPLQMYFLNSRFNQIVAFQSHNQSVIQDRTIYEDAYIFAKNLTDSGLLSPRDYQTYYNVFKSLCRMISAPHLLIYLKASVHKLVEQIAKRGRDYENNISIKYLRDLNKHYGSWIADYKEGDLLVIDVDDLDYLNRPEDLIFIVEKINQKIGKPVS